MTEGASTNHAAEDGTSERHPLGSYRGILATAIPLSLEQLLQTITTPIYLVVMMHMANPEIEVGSLFSYMLPVLLVISAPITSLNTLVNVYAVHAANIVHLRKYAITLGGLGSLLGALVAFTPLGDLIFRTILGIPAEEYRPTMLAMRIAILLPILWSLRQLAVGVLIRTGHSWAVLVGRAILFVLSILVLWGGLATNLLPGAALGALTLVVSLVAQTGFLMIRAVAARRELERHPIEDTPATFRELARVGIPLTLTPMILSIVPFMMSAALGRLPGIVVSLAVWPIISSLSSVSLGFGNSLDQTSIVHGIDEQARSRLWRIYVVTGVLLMGFNALLLSTGVFRWVFESIEALDPATADITDNVMWLLTPWFLLYTLAGFYWALLSRMHLTRPYLTGALVKLVVIGALFGTTIALDPITGVYVAALASILGSATILLWLGRAYHLAHAARVG